LPVDKTSEKYVISTALILSITMRFTKLKANATAFRTCAAWVASARQPKEDATLTVEQSPMCFIHRTPSLAPERGASLPEVQACATTTSRR
jgi:hypothetical protein